MKPITQITTEEIEQTLVKVVQEPSSLGYMTTKLDETINNATCTAASVQAMALINDGVAPEVAGMAASDMILALAFNLGLIVGRELQASESFAEMMRGGMDDGPAPDAGNPEHGG